MSNKEFIADLRERAKSNTKDEEYWLKLNEDMFYFFNQLYPTREERQLFYTTVMWDSVGMIVDGIRVEREKQKKSKNKDNKEVSE